MKKQLFFSLIFATLLSCTKIIDFDDDGLANQVVVNGIISTESDFSVYLTKSSSILEGTQNNKPLEGTLDLYEDETLIRQFPSQVGAFSATDIETVAGKEYRIVVTSNGKVAEAKTSIPEQAEVTGIDTTTITTEYGSKTTNYKVTIKDPAGDDYYRLVVMNENLRAMTFIDQENKKTTAYYKQTIQYSLASDDPVFKSVYSNFGDELIDYGPDNEYFIFPDDYFQGKEYTVQFRILNYGYYYYSPYGYDYGYPANPGMGNGIIYERNTIHIQRLSKDLYNYLKYLKLYNHYRDNPFSEPVPVYSNVKKGIGIFAGFNDDTIFEFEKIYIPFSMDTIKVEEGNYY